MELLLFLTLMWPPTGAEWTPPVSSVVSCVFMETCLLPCSFKPGNVQTNEWIKHEGDLLVHVFRDGKDELHNQNLPFRGRTSMFPEQVPAGNASLQLVNVTVDDEGHYRCLVITEESSTEDWIRLRVESPVKTVVMELKGDVLVCSSGGIYPQPNVSWAPHSGQKPQFKLLKEKLYSLNSSLTVDLHPPKQYSCNISTDHSWKSATYSLQPPKEISTDMTIPCVTSMVPEKSLVWTFNYSQTIVTESGTEVIYTAPWRPHVECVSESGSLTLKKLSHEHLGVYECKLLTEDILYISRTELRQTPPPLAEGPSAAGISMAVVILLLIVIIIFILVWRRKHQQTMLSFGEKPIQAVALGRPFSLGMFYDCRSDTLVPGVTLWDKEKLEREVSATPKPNIEFEIVASESISDKSSSLGVDSSLKASFLSGLVHVGGSAKYLNDNKKSSKQARVTLHYKTTTVFKTLNVDQLGIINAHYKEVIEKGLATHVVTGILYGAQAFFVFDQEASEDESVQDIQGNLKVIIKKIPLINIEGDGALKMEDTDRAKVNKFSCTFHGDFLLEKSPTTFEEAVRVYQDLPKLLGPNKENAVPVTVYLLPLCKLDSKASKLVRQISLRLVTEAENLLEGFTDLEMRCNDLLDTPAAQNLPHISKKVRNFKALFFEFKLGLQRTLAQKLPSIRGGGEEEAALAEVLKKVAESPFSSCRLNQWMEEKEQEVNTIRTLMKMMKNTEMVPSEYALTNKVCDSENALVFVLTSLGSAEPFLSELEQHLRGTPSNRSNIPEPRRWYSSEDVMDSVRRKAKGFGNFAEANKDRDKRSLRFLAVGLTDENHEGCAIYMFEGGFTNSDNFELPSKPAAVTVGEVTHSSVSLLFSAPSEGVQNITGYRVEFCETGQEEWNQRPQAGAGAVTVTGLSPNTEYSVRVRAVTAVGVGPAAAPQTSIRTSP